MTTSPTTAEDRIAEIRARLDAATEGPWIKSGHDVDGNANVGAFCQDCTPPCGALGERVATAGDADAELIANAPADLSWLLSELEAAQARLIAERDEARQDRDEWKALHGRAVHEMQARIGQQERVNADLRRAHDHACAERDTYRDLAKELYDDEPCSFDHHGGCQAHGWLEPGPGETCPDGRAQRLFEGGDNDAHGD